MKNRKKNGNGVKLADKFHDHPGLKKGEVFIGNKCKETYDKLPFISKRIGDESVNKSDILENMLFPVFVKAEEYDRRKNEIK